MSGVSSIVPLRGKCVIPVYPGPPEKQRTGFEPQSSEFGRLTFSPAKWKTQPPRCRMVGLSRITTYLFGNLDGTHGVHGGEIHIY